MLKGLSSATFNQAINAKCGEIYCQSSTEFSILCVFCEMKIFDFADFLLHFQNTHFENNLLKTEEVNIQCTPYLEVNIKSESNKDDYSGNESDLAEAPLLAEFPMPDVKATEEFRYAESDANPESWSDEEDDNDEYKPPVKIKKPKDFKEHKCKQCDVVCKNGGLLKIHIKHFHQCSDTTSEDKVFKCDQCSEEFPNQRRLNAHSVQEHGGIPCPKCESRFKSGHGLNRHAAIHSGVKNFVCDFENCGKRFFTRRHLTAHKHIHTDVKNFVCETCGYSCREWETLRVHYRKHTGEKPYSCNICAKRFASSSLLSEHKASHATDRPHKCNVCGATFARQKALYHHNFLHLGIKKFKCKICGNAYAQAAGLAGHMRKHKEGLF